MRELLIRLRGAVGDPPAVQFCDACGSVQVCDTSCRAAAARDRATNSYLSVTGPH